MKIEDIPKRHQDILDVLVKHDPEVAEATVGLSRKPSVWLNEDQSVTDGAPICGCFLGTYAWQLAEKHGAKLTQASYSSAIAVAGSTLPYGYIAKRTGLDTEKLYQFGVWCKFGAQDRAAAYYVTRKLRAMAKAGC